MGQKMQVEPEEVRSIVKVVSNSLASVKDSLSETKYNVKVNKLESISEYEDAIEDVNKTFSKYIASFEANLVNITQGIITLEQLDADIAAGVSSFVTETTSSRGFSNNGF